MNFNLRNFITSALSDVTTTLLFIRNLWYALKGVPKLVSSLTIVTCGPKPPRITTDSRLIVIPKSIRHKPKVWTTHPRYVAPVESSLLSGGTSNGRQEYYYYRNYINRFFFHRISICRFFPHKIIFIEILWKKSVYMFSVVIILLAPIWGASR